MVLAQLGQKNCNGEKRSKDFPILSSLQARFLWAC